MKVLLVVHGIVQGVGYRSFVRDIALKNKIRGSVRNVSDGSVEIVAVGDEGSLERLEDEIRVSGRYGPQVTHVEKTFHDDGGDSFTDFVIERDKEL